jgi:hypothetical protein
MQQHQQHQQQEEREQGLDYARHWDLLSALRALRYRATLPGTSAAAAAWLVV